MALVDELKQALGSVQEPIMAQNQNPGRSLELQAYDGQHIPNEIDADPTAGYVALAKSDPHYQAPHQILGPPSGRYNCHGLVFGSRRTNIPSISMLTYSLAGLLQAELYVQTGHAQLGDIVAYRDDANDIVHTGIVSRVERFGNSQVVMVWSKWGSLEECEHHLLATPYSGTQIEFW